MQAVSGGDVTSGCVVFVGVVLAFVTKTSGDDVMELEEVDDDDDIEVLAVEVVLELTGVGVEE